MPPPPKKRVDCRLEDVTNFPAIAAFLSVHRKNMKHEQNKRVAYVMCSDGICYHFACSRRCEIASIWFNKVGYELITMPVRSGWRFRLQAAQTLGSSPAKTEVYKGPNYYPNYNH